MAFSIFGDPTQDWRREDGSILYSPGALNANRAYAYALMRDKKEARNAGDGLYNATNSIMAAMLMRDSNLIDKERLDQQANIGKAWSEGTNLPGSEGVQTTYAPMGSSGVPASPAPPSADSYFGQFHPEFATRYKKFLDDANADGIPLKPGSGFRSVEQQAKLYANRANNPYPVAEPGKSGHNYGLAGDFSPGGKLTDDQWGRVRRHAMANGLKWGGDFNDPIHVQLGDGNYGALKNAERDERGFVKLPPGFIPQIQPAQSVPGQPYQVAQLGGPSTQNPAQIAPGFYGFGGGTGSGVTPQHIKAAKMTMANPSLAEPWMIEQAKDTFSRSREPGGLKALSNGWFENAKGDKFYIQQPEQTVPQGQIMVRPTLGQGLTPVDPGTPYVMGAPQQPPMQPQQRPPVAPQQRPPAAGATPQQGASQPPMASSAPPPMAQGTTPQGGGMNPGVGGFRPTGMIGTSPDQARVAEQLSENRKSDMQNAMQAVPTVEKLKLLEGKLGEVWRGPVAEMGKPLIGILNGLGIPIDQAVNADTIEGARTLVSSLGKHLMDQNMITQREFDAYKAGLPNLGTAQGSEKPIFDILYKGLRRQQALGQLAAAYNDGLLGDQPDANYSTTRMAIMADHDIHNNIVRHNQTGALMYFNPVNGSYVPLTRGGAR